MKSRISKPLKPSLRRRPLRLGFVPLVDCAPLVVAQELGFFAHYGLDVILSQELGWASIRDKIVYGELEAAQAAVGQPFAATLGLNCPPCRCLTALVLNLHGNGITLSNQLWQQGVRTGSDLKKLRLENRGREKFLFGVVSLAASHLFLLRQWLKSAGLAAGTDYEIVVVPPPQMPGHLAAGLLDGYCVGEPWNSVAVHEDTGFCIALSMDLAPGHPEKVLMVREDFARRHAEDHRQMIRALVEACLYCDQPKHHGEVAQILARSCYVGASASLILRSLRGPFDFGHGRKEERPHLHLFHRHEANRPTPEKAIWVLQQMEEAGLITPGSAAHPDLHRVFREDLYREALETSAPLPTSSVQPPTTKKTTHDKKARLAVA